MTAGLQTYNDSSGDVVCIVKWYWGELNNDFLYTAAAVLGAQYIALPTCEKPAHIWDSSTTYCYAKPKDVTIKEVTQKDKLGWFLDR